MPDNVIIIPGCTACCPTNVTTDCCPNNALPTTLHATITAGCGGCTAGFLLTWVSGFIWQGSTPCGGDTLSFTFKCNGNFATAFQLFAFCDGLPVLGVPGALDVDTVSCNPFNANFAFTVGGTALTTCCATNFTVNTTL